MVNQKMSNIIKKMPRSLKLVGSIARGDVKAKDIDFITKENMESVMKKIDKIFKNVKRIRIGKMNASLLINKVPVDIFRYEKPIEEKFIKFARTNEKGRNIYYRKQAKKKGLLLNDKGLFRKNGHRVPIKTIAQLTKYLKGT